MEIPGRLSLREQQVLNGLLEKLANNEVADRLHISERTVKFHVRRRANLILLCSNLGSLASRVDSQRLIQSIDLS